MKPINNKSSGMSLDHSHFKITYTTLVRPNSGGLIKEAISYPLYPSFKHTYSKSTSTGFILNQYFIIQNTISMKIWPFNYSSSYFLS